MTATVKIAIIGGTGFYELLDDVEDVVIDTPYGETSAPLQVGRFEGCKIIFLARHGKRHSIPPHKVNSRANIWALKELGVERVIAPGAVGSLRMDYKPGEIVITDQYLDFTKKRDYTYYEGDKVCHISTADPFCDELRGLFYEQAKISRIPVHEHGTYVCVEGPRFSTRAESRMFKNFADIIGMTLVPECQLAIEQEMCYVSLAMITDYDVWAEKPVDAKAIIATMKCNLVSLKKLLCASIPLISGTRTCACKDALKRAGV